MSMKLLILINSLFSDMSRYFKYCPFNYLILLKESSELLHIIAFLGFLLKILHVDNPEGKASLFVQQILARRQCEVLYMIKTSYRKKSVRNIVKKSLWKLNRFWKQRQIFCFFAMNTSFKQLKWIASWWCHNGKSGLLGKLH